MAPWEPMRLTRSIHADVLLMYEADDAIVPPAHSLRFQAARPSTQTVALEAGSTADPSTPFVHGTISGCRARTLCVGDRRLRRPGARRSRCRAQRRAHGLHAGQPLPHRGWAAEAPERTSLPRPQGCPGVARRHGRPAAHDVHAARRGQRCADLGRPARIAQRPARARGSRQAACEDQRADRRSLARRPARDELSFAARYQRLRRMRRCTAWPAPPAGAALTRYRPARRPRKRADNVSVLAPALPSAVIVRSTAE